jgi:hypothetical protein
MHTKEALRLTDDLIGKMVAAQAGLTFASRAHDDLKRYLDRRLPIAECMRLGLRVASLKTPAELTDVDKTELSRVATVLAKSTDLYSSYNLACTYALFAALDAKYRSHSFNCLNRMFSIARSLESLGAAFAGVCAKMAKRAKNDAAFKHLWDNSEFDRLVSQHLDSKQTAGVTTVNVRNAGDRPQLGMLPTQSETAAVY